MMKKRVLGFIKGELPFLRDIKVFWHVGECGSGKSYTSQKIIEEYGRDSLYFLTNYENGCFDNYCGEPVIFMDDFKGQLKFRTFLRILQGYNMNIYAECNKVKPLWKEIHITSVFPPEVIYYRMVGNGSHLYTMQQLTGKINAIVYHFKKNEKYEEYLLPMENYINYTVLKFCARYLIDTNDLLTSLERIIENRIVFY